MKEEDLKNQKTFCKFDKLWVDDHCEYAISFEGGKAKFCLFDEVYGNLDYMKDLYDLSDLENTYLWVANRIFEYK